MEKESQTPAKKFSWDASRGAAKRPWRLWGTKPNGKFGSLPSRAFSNERRAHNAALIDVRWGEFRAIEVYDVRTGWESGTYSMRATGQVFFDAPPTSHIVTLLKKKGLIHG